MSSANFHWLKWSKIVEIITFFFHRMRFYMYKKWDVLRMSVLGLDLVQDCRNNLEVPTGSYLRHERTA